MGKQGTRVFQDPKKKYEFWVRDNVVIVSSVFFGPAQTYMAQHSLYFLKFKKHQSYVVL